MENEFYTNERVVGHGIGLSYEVEEDTLIGSDRHKIRITEGDVGWKEQQEVVLTPEEWIEATRVLIDEHEEEIRQLYDNHSKFIEGMEGSELIKEIQEE